MISRVPRKSCSKVLEAIKIGPGDGTPLHKETLEALYSYALMANKVDGVAAEAGVFSGSSLFVLANAFDREIYAFDSFKGLPGLTDEDAGFHREGQFSCSLDKVKTKLSFTSKVCYYEGWFSDTFCLVGRDVRFSYVFCDVDLYQSYLECFAFFYPRMSPGGVLICDDYFCVHTPGAKLAIDEMIQVYGITRVYEEQGLVVIEV